MTKMFSNLKTENVESGGDTLGGGNFDPVPTAVYSGTIELMYAGKARSSNAQNVTVHFKTEDGKEVRETIYITNRDAEPFYIDKSDGKTKRFLPGFELINDICLLTTGEELTDLETETKTVKIYDYDAKKEVPTPVECFTAAHGQPIELGIIREIVDKQKKNTSSGEYENTGETRTQNAINKAFHPETGRTVSEYQHEVETPEFREAWAKANTKDRNKAKGVSGGGADAGAGSSGTGAPGGAKKKLFGK